MKKIVFILLQIILAGNLFAQKEITLEDIWLKYSYSAKGVYGWRSMKDGLHYTVKQGNKIVKYDYNTGMVKQEWVFTVGGNALEFDDYTFSADEKKILLSTQSEPIYRYSSLDKNYIYEVDNDRLYELDEGGKQQNAHFSPDGNQVAYLKANNIFIKDLNTGLLIQATTDGHKNHIINGGSDWVYEEEFAIVRAFEWSPDGKSIAYLRFDETEVPLYEMAMFEGRLYPKDYEFKYPKVGEKNAKVTLHVFNLATQQSHKIDLGSTYEYIPRLGWTPDGKIYAITMNRMQNELKIHLVEPISLQSKVLFTETRDTYIEIHDHFRFFNGGKTLLWTSEQDGFNHIYLIDVATGKQTQVTRGAWEVTEVHGVDEKNKLIYYESTEISPMQRQSFTISLDGKKKNPITPAVGVNKVQFSEGFQYMLCNTSQAGKPSVFSLCDNQGKVIRVLEDNRILKEKLEVLALNKPEFFSFKNSTGIDLNGYMIKPRGFNPNEKYPVLMFVYGGPGSQQVMDQWGGSNYLWFQMLAQQGYMIACVDNRGTGGRGRAFRDCTYKQLGKLETEDQIDAARYIGSLPYVDAARIGIFGWSYGGYMSSLCITKGAEVFKAAIAVAPVTNWKFYDSIYTERYMGTKESNPDGYDANAPIAFADKLKGNYLLIHGTADDNVHWQNTAEMIRALVKAGKQFEQFIYPDKNHGIYGGNTRYHLYTLMTDFLKRKL